MYSSIGVILAKFGIINGKFEEFKNPIEEDMLLDWSAGGSESGNIKVLEFLHSEGLVWLSSRDSRRESGPLEGSPEVMVSAELTPMGFDFVETLEKGRVKRSTE